MTVTKCDKCLKDIQGPVLGKTDKVLEVTNGVKWRVDVDVRMIEVGVTEPTRVDLCKSCYREIVTRALSERVE